MAPRNGPYAPIGGSVLPSVQLKNFNTAAVSLQSLIDDAIAAGSFVPTETPMPGLAVITVEAQPLRWICKSQDTDVDPTITVGHLVQPGTFTLTTPFNRTYLIATSASTIAQVSFFTA